MRDLMTASNDQTQLAEYLQPTSYIDCDHPDVIEYAHAVAGRKATEIEKATALFYAVRDDIRYDPYKIDLRPEGMMASSALSKRYGFCIPKAVLLAAAARAEDIPSRLGFADVKNHLNTERLKQIMQTDVFAFHGYTELFLEGKWVKATPAFNRTLCERFNVAPLEFDGKNDALLQQSDEAGQRYMEYLTDHGLFADLPFDLMIATWEKHYPTLMAEGGYKVSGDFEAEGGTG
jgi:transglutaminase-like putative cysteine protease